MGETAPARINLSTFPFDELGGANSGWSRGNIVASSWWTPAPDINQP